MNGDSSRMIAEIRTAIEKGTLTHTEMERRLEAAIAAETGKEDSPADMEMIRTCQSLLWELDTHGKESFVDDTEQSLAAFKAKRHTTIGTKKKLPVFALRAVVAAAAILLVSVGIDTLVRREWLVGSSTDDEQQYVISGREIRTGLVEEGQADDSSAQSHNITTTDLDEAVEVLGFTPVMPQWVPDGWDVLTYYAAQAESGGRFIITYACDGQEYNLIYQVIYYRDAERASASFEQNKSGEEYTLTDGKIVYITDNYDDLTCVWNEGLALYSLIGPGDKSSFTRIIESIKER